MSWICPTCTREVPLYEAECPHCVLATPAQAAESPAQAAEPPTQEAESPAQEAEPPPLGEPASEEPLTLVHGGNHTAKRSRASWAVYLLLAAGLTALPYWLWRSQEVSLKVDSEPGGAVILLDSARIGETPVELPPLEAGESHHLRVELEGYQPFEQDFIARAQRDPWVIPLERSYDPLLDEKIVQDLVGQIGQSGREALFSHDLAETLFTVNPLIEQNPWLTQHTWTKIFQQVVKANFDGDSAEFLRHLQDYQAELARGKTSKEAWYEHVHECEKVCRPVVTEVFKRHLLWLRRSGFTVIYFPLNQYELSPEQTAKISQFIAAHNLAEDRSRQVLLVGRASRIGGQVHNLELSRNRVASVAQALTAQLPDGRDRLRSAHLGFEPPQITPSVVEFLGLDAALSEAQHNQSVMLIVSEPIPPTQVAAD